MVSANVSITEPICLKVILIIDRVNHVPTLGLTRHQLRLAQVHLMLLLYHLLLPLKLLHHLSYYLLLILIEGFVTLHSHLCAYRENWLR